jgi:hypothetical protein
MKKSVIEEVINDILESVSVEEELIIASYLLIYLDSSFFFYL